MSKYKFTRRDFVAKTTAGLVGAALSGSGLPNNKKPKAEIPGAKTKAPDLYDTFLQEVEKLPAEELYDYHKRLTEGPIHVKARDMKAQPSPTEVLIREGWKIVLNSGNSIVLKNAAQDFQDYMEKAMEIRIEIEERNSLKEWKTLDSCIVVGTRDQLPGYGLQLKKSKDYEIIVTSESLIIVCGYDEKGAMYGLYNLEARMNFREAPILSKNLRTIRHSLFDRRMVLPWMGWMEWPDTVLSYLAHDGYDGIFASVYANPNGDRSTAESSTDFYGRVMFNRSKQNPKDVHDLINRAARFGINVYAPIIYQFLGTPESETGLRKLVRNIVKEFPAIKGYVLLTEGFWYKKWGGLHGASKEYTQDWARNWCRAVDIVKEECHKIDPAIEILPWEYNIDFRPQNAELKKYFIQKLPEDTIPLLTWENGKSFEIDGLKGFLRDYSLSQIGPAEVTDAQIHEARRRNMKVYCKVDTFSSWQFGTVPYLPVPHQWFARYDAVNKYKVDGTLESWSSGYKPNFMSELRTWTCWSDSPPMEELLNSMARRIFGVEGKDMAIKAWEHFSRAIQMVPDTGPSMGTNNAIGNPLFFKTPPARTSTYAHSWWDFETWKSHLSSRLNPYWPFTVSRMVFYPDFTNKINKAELYARSSSGIQVDKSIAVLPVFLKFMRQASDEMEKGLKLYRAASLACNETKRQLAVREVIVAEQIHRMMQSNYAILEFEDLRLKMVATGDSIKRNAILDKMSDILKEEIARTQLSLLAATRDSRLGFQFEQDYVYTPYSLKEKLGVLKETLDMQLRVMYRK